MSDFSRPGRGGRELQQRGQLGQRGRDTEGAQTGVWAWPRLAVHLHSLNRGERSGSLRSSVY